VTWVKSRVGLIRSRPLRRLAEDIGVDPVCALGMLHALWHEVMDDGASGDVTDWRDGEIGDAAAWVGDNTRFCDALRRHGFIVPDEDDPTREVIADWWEIGGGLLEQRERKRLAMQALRERRKQEEKEAEEEASGVEAPKRSRAPRRTSGDDPAFERFWEVYPRRDAKAKARDAWKKLGPDSDLADRIVARVTEQAKSPKWLEDGGRFIPLPATYLNGERWQDEGVSVSALPTPPKRLAI
jgi:predicted outer membrane lipoprotein